MSFPYEDNFRTYCKQKKKLATSTISLACSSISTFWNYYSSSLDSTEANAENVTAGDIRNFLDSLENNLHMKSNTVNKYLSHLKMYFVFLSEYGYIITYPLLSLRGNRFDRKQHYVIGWENHLSELIRVNGLHPETIKMMTAIASGFKPKEIMILHVNELLDRIKANDLKEYIKNHTDFTNTDDPYLFSRHDGKPYASDFNINQRIAADRQIVGMPLTIHKLRMSYVYSVLSNSKLTEADYIAKLRLSIKTLNYYRKNMTLYVETSTFELKKR
ncbi:integrase [uncultured Lactobacillus sp.]|uniref:integrase n=1 Tax=uncultured Lactobacillus sp. TaxID=153152 RepID=UPI0026216B44|nr:integrase [uncultured Lactobacillus sp.]